ncbi:DUF2637 domain-containing protein [Actinomadura xylanilytica]|uniref:DUF2637 domain-containing protein n=1 Tax=Actinomadura xylanilytica TaxID=887459 RepID=UPI00255AC4FB|nr:DUF2637 domain-containing protein [Actinomadura xylanilytica]MDL4772485.1 DUF2637 domain-containing protein [Actinomadura xylanilytica]
MTAQHTAPPLAPSLGIPVAPELAAALGAEGEVPSDARGRALTSSEFTAVATVAALVAVLGVLGFVNSFTAVADASRSSFGRLAWTVPLGIDLGIGIFAALDIVLARLDMRVKWLRLIPWALTAATVYLNVADEHTVFGKVAHAILPGLWVIAVEVAAHVIRIRAGIEAGTRMDGIRTSRWLMAPWPTLKLWRRMVLWEIRSYPDALGRERDRLLALTDLQDTYGRWTWRRKAPRRVRALYRLGELVPAPATSAPSGAPSDHSSAGAPSLPEGDRPALEAGPSATPVPAPSDPPSDSPSTVRTRTRKRTAAAKSTTRTGGRSARSSRPGTRTRKPAAPDVDDLMPLGWRIAADLDTRGQALTRDTLAGQLREAGHTAGNARVGTLLARLKTEAPTDPTTPPAGLDRPTVAAVPTAEGDDPR